MASSIFNFNILIPIIIEELGSVFITEGSTLIVNDVGNMGIAVT